VISRSIPVNDISVSGRLTAAVRQLPVIRHWSLVRYLVRARLISNRQELAFGMFWWIAEPLVLCLIYIFLISYVLGRGREDHGFFICSAILPWRWFASATNSATMSLVRKSNIIKSLRTDAYVFPLADIGYATVMFCWSLVVYPLLMVWYQRYPTIYVLALPVVMAVELLYITSIALILAAVAVYFRDVSEGWGLVTRIWFYMSPCLYSIDNVPESIRSFYFLNPFSTILPSYRNILMHGQPPYWGKLAVVAVVGVVLLCVSNWLFGRLSRGAANYL